MITNIIFYFINMIVIYKLFIIKQLGIITDIVNYITKLWLTLEMVVIEPPSVEEWERNKSVEYQRTYLLDKHNILYIEYEYIGDIGTSIYLGVSYTPINYY
jgi:hypothetical protein